MTSNLHGGVGRRGGWDWVRGRRPGLRAGGPGCGGFTEWRVVGWW